MDGITRLTVFDGGPGDACPIAGCVTYIGTIGVWLVNVSTGLTSSPTPFMDLNSVDLSTAAGTLKILLGDTDFTLVLVRIRSPSGWPSAAPPPDR